MRRYLAALGLAVLIVTAYGSSQSLAPGTGSVVSAPVRVAHTGLGAVGFREIGSGPALVLVMGYGWTMEDWDPRLVHALALHHRVVMFDNSGVGRTQELPQPFPSTRWLIRPVRSSPPSAWAGRTCWAGRWAALSPAPRWRSTPTPGTRSCSRTGLASLPWSIPSWPARLGSYRPFRRGTRHGSALAAMRVPDRGPCGRASTSTRGAG